MLDELAFLRLFRGYFKHGQPYNPAKRKNQLTLYILFVTLISIEARETEYSPVHRRKEGLKLAGTKDSGKKINFSMSEKDLAEKISEYQSKVVNGDFGAAFMPQWDHFCAFLGFCRADVQECYDKGVSGENAYSKRAEMLKKHETWVFGEMFARCGRSSATAIYLSKQKRLDGSRYSDQDLKTANGPAKVVINFGGDDPRAKRAGK